MFSNIIQEYDWLANEFDLSKQEVDEVKNLSEEEFYFFSRRLQEETDMSESDYSVDDLFKIIDTPASNNRGTYYIPEIDKYWPV